MNPSSSNERKDGLGNIFNSLVNCLVPGGASQIRSGLHMGFSTQKGGNQPCLYDSESCRLPCLHIRGGNPTGPGIHQCHQLKRKRSDFPGHGRKSPGGVSSPHAKNNPVLAMIQYYPNRDTAGGGFFSRRYGFISTMKWIIQKLAMLNRLVQHV